MNSFVSNLFPVRLVESSMSICPTLYWMSRRGCLSVPVCTHSLFVPAVSVLHPLSPRSVFCFNHFSSICLPSPLSPPTVLLTLRTVSRPRSSPSSPPGRKDKQASTCSHGILMTSITLASSPAKARPARGSVDVQVYQRW